MKFYKLDTWMFFQVWSGLKVLLLGAELQQISVVVLVCKSTSAEIVKTYCAY